mmetsp:Transcript_2735/g.4424  ORF Transcript_2735/g.4424 Transcript_2735/m.4424 type:complete len:474 (-) Transcript_2735:290-1711(-)
MVFFAPACHDWKTLSMDPAGGASCAKPKSPTYRSSQTANAVEHKRMSSSLHPHAFKIQRPSSAPDPKTHESRRTPKIKVEGFLEKRSKIMHVWHERYFVVTERELRWYKDKEHAVDLKGGKAVKLQNQKLKKLVINSHIPLPGRPSARIVLELQDVLTNETIEISFISEAQREEWETQIMLSFAAQYSSVHTTPYGSPEVMSDVDSHNKFFNPRSPGHEREHQNLREIRTSIGKSEHYKEAPDAIKLHQTSLFPLDGRRKQKAGTERKPPQRSMAEDEVGDSQGHKGPLSGRRSLSVDNIVALATHPGSASSSSRSMDTSSGPRLLWWRALAPFILSACFVASWIFMRLQAETTTFPSSQAEMDEPDLKGASRDGFSRASFKTRTRDWSTITFPATDLHSTEPNNWTRFLSLMHSWLLLDLNAYNSQHSYAYMIVFAVLGWLYYVGSRLFLTPAKQPAVCFDEGPAGDDALPL